jgi:hypothetical protein
LHISRDDVHITGGVNVLLGKTMFQDPFTLDFGFVLIIKGNVDDVFIGLDPLSPNPFFV